MKKGLIVGAMALSSVLLIGCQQPEDTASTLQTQENTTSNVSVTVEGETQVTMATMAMMADGVSMKDGKMIMIKNGESSDMIDTITMDNGTKVDPTGKIIAADGSTMMFKEGQMMGMDGKMMETGTTEHEMGMSMAMGETQMKNMEESMETVSDSDKTVVTTKDAKAETSTSEVK